MVGGVQERGAPEECSTGEGIGTRVKSREGRIHLKQKSRRQQQQGQQQQQGRRWRTIHETEQKKHPSQAK